LLKSDRNVGRRSLVFALLALAWMAAIFWVSSGPVPPVVPDQALDILAKKVGHFAAYALLAGLWWIALRGRMTPRTALVVAFAITTGYAGTDELHQAFIATRHPSAIDVGIDALGAAAGLRLGAKLSRRRALGSPEAQ
jgi:VanZ family protein